jgi:hypothetical protein
MPKRSSKKGSKKQSPAPETALVPHRAPNLTELLERASLGKLSDVQQYLSAGGSPNVLVEVVIQQAPGPVLLAQIIGGRFNASLLASVAASEHSDAAASIKQLFQAGATADAISNSTSGWERTALMLACSVSNNLHAVHCFVVAQTLAIWLAMVAVRSTLLQWKG